MSRSIDRHGDSLTHRVDMSHGRKMDTEDMFIVQPQQLFEGIHVLLTVTNDERMNQD